ncbi:hypothetical protein FACS1894208_10470 [Clostridia bacterium]|nr:hypothetical protein FACS1894208_10470 [Clostridia bacterium]
MVKRVGYVPEAVFYVVCDGCGIYVGTAHDDFRSAAKSVPENWETVKENGTWKNHCPECVRINHDFNEMLRGL